MNLKGEKYKFLLVYIIYIMRHIKFMSFLQL